MTGIGTNVRTKVGAKVGTTVRTRVGARVSNSEHLHEIRENKRGNRRILEQLCELSENKHGNRRVKGTRVGSKVNSRGMEQDP